MIRLTCSIVMVSLVLAAAACKKKQETANDKTGTAQPASVDAAPATPDAAAPAAAALTTGEMIEIPFPSLDLYCEAVSAGFVKDECWSQGDQIEMCSCAPADKDDLAGDVKAAGTSTNLVGAHLVVVADAAADYAHCSVALQLPSGWHIVHKAFPCGAAPVSHDGGIAVTVNGFTIADDTMKLAWTSDDGRAKTKHTLACTSSAPDKATCTPAAAAK